MPEPPPAMLTSQLPASSSDLPASNSQLPASGRGAPPKAALAICSDLDETPDAETYFEIIRFLTTTEETSMGPGVGLDIGNSIYFDMPPGHFSYWNTTEENRERIRALIRTGHIDVLHSYGDLATTRAHAARALDELHKHDCYLKVWVDHAQAPTNFGADIMRGHGDEPGHPAYHADLTLQYGIKYVWRGRVTSVIGQNQPFSFRHLISDLLAPREAGRSEMGDGRSEEGSAISERPTSNSHVATSSSQLLASSRTVAKECGKQLLARCGNRKYAMHGLNQILAPCSLRDGQVSLEFLRCNPHWGGVSCGDRGDQIHEVLTRRFLDRLVERQGKCILYTHLGKLGERRHGGQLCPCAWATLRCLSDYRRSAQLVVTSTRRLLDHLCATRGQ